MLHPLTADATHGLLALYDGRIVCSRVVAQLYPAVHQRHGPEIRRAVTELLRHVHQQARAHRRRNLHLHVQPGSVWTAGHYGQIV